MNSDFLNRISGYMTDPYMLGITIAVLFMLSFVIYSSSSSNMQPNYNSFNIVANNSASSLSSIIFFILFCLAFYYLYNQYYENAKFKNFVNNLFEINTPSENQPDVNINLLNNSNITTNNNNVEINKNKPITPVDTIENRQKKQVFNVFGNEYTFDDAKAVCAAHGAELATYDQIEQAYQNGAEWCNYGWSADQLALFPTQKKTYEELKKIPGHGNHCGRPGINGGYIANKNVKFGVNCYGVKPDPTQSEYDLMKIEKIHPIVEEDAQFQKQVDNIKQNLDNVLLLPFNKSSWRE